MRARWAPLAWGLGATSGALVAAIVSPYVPGWGIAVAPPAAMILFAVGGLVAPDDELVATVLRMSVALTLGFLAASIPLTLAWLAAVPERSLALEDAVGAATQSDARATLVEMWALMGAAVPIGITGLAARRMKRTRA